MSMSVLEKKVREAKRVSYILAAAPTDKKNGALLKIAEQLKVNEEKVLAANKIDTENLRQKEGFTNAFYDRLLLTPERIDGMADGLKDIVALPDPVGELSDMTRRPNGIMVGSMRTPLGVVGIIYEARPNVTVDAAGLALKSGNAVVLRGSSEAINSNKALVAVIQDSLEICGLPRDGVVLIEETDRTAAKELMSMNKYLDVLIPRGGKALIKAVIENATVPVIQTGAGNCHTYIDEHASLDMAVEIAVNAKVQRPGVCNAMETLLVHRNIAAAYLPAILSRLMEKGVEIRGCVETGKHHPDVRPATDEDWDTEYLDLILAVKVVDSIQEAIDHIHTYGTGHSEAIVSADYLRTKEFYEKVDAAAVYVNASTRFTDGFVFGLGAEMGISTQKLHARGPMGLKALTSLKYIILGEGQIR